MSTYQVLANLQENIVIVEEKFSYKGFIFGFCWLLYHRMWQHGLSIMIFELLMFQILDPVLFTFIVLIIHFVIGIYASHQICIQLIKNGYSFKHLIIASSYSEAELRLLTS